MTYLIWDMDGVMIPGRGTTHLANGYDKGDPRVFMERFLHECGQEDTPPYPIKMEDLEAGFKKWEENYNNGPITTIGELATCLTDLRHKLKVFPSSAQTIYTKNAILNGLTLKRIKEIADELPYNPGCEECIDEIHEDDFAQYLFSNSNWALIDAVARKFGFAYNEGAVPWLKATEEASIQYTPGLYGGNDVLDGEIDKYNKKERVLPYLENEKINPEDVVAIDDTEIDMLNELRKKGATVIGFFNINDRDMKERDLDKMNELGIPVLFNGLHNFAEIVMNPNERTIGKYCG